MVMHNTTTMSPWMYKIVSMQYISSCSHTCKKENLIYGTINWMVRSFEYNARTGGNDHVQHQQNIVTV